MSSCGGPFSMTCTLHFTYISMFQYWQDVHELGLVPYKDPGWYIWKQKMEQMAPPYPALAERMVIATSWEEFHNITEFKLLAKDRITNSLNIYFLYSLEPLFSLFAGNLHQADQHHI